MIAILFALPAESSEFIRLLARSASGNGKCPESIHGQIHGRSVAVFHTGVGERSCRARIESILRDSQFRYLISTGFAGALDHELKVGDLVVSDNLSSPELLHSPHLDLAANRFVVGKLKTVPKIISSEAERVQWATESAALAIDMETEFIAEACAAHKIPLLSLRVKAIRLRSRCLLLRRYCSIWRSRKRTLLYSFIISLLTQGRLSV